jgi:nitrogenase molybdenum-cofactor synthesis protein NifE
MWAEVRKPAPWDAVDPLLVAPSAAQLAAEAAPA